MKGMSSYLLIFVAFITLVQGLNGYIVSKFPKKNNVFLLRAEEKKGGLFGNIFNSLAANEFKPKNEEEKEFLKRNGALALKQRRAREAAKAAANPPAKK